MKIINTDRNNYDTIIKKFISQYKKSNKPIVVDFKKIVQLKNKDRIIHNLHPYPAKLIFQIPFFFLNNNVFSKPKNLVLDTFCGTGTVLHESLLSNRHSIGIDINPIACLISESKLTSYNFNILQKNLRELRFEINNRAGIKFDDKKINLKRLEFWYDKNVINELFKIKESIATIKNPKYRKFFTLCFSILIRKVSHADKHISVPVKVNVKEKYSSLSVRRFFFEIADKNILKVNSKKLNTKNKFFILNNDIKNISVENFQKTIKKKFNKSKVDLVITSPPYASAQKYIRASLLNLLWLNHTESKIRKLNYDSVGKEHYRSIDYANFISTNIKFADSLIRKIQKVNPLRACIVSNYLKDLNLIFNNLSKLIKKNGYLIIVVGNNTVSNYKFNTQKYIIEILANLGFSLELKLIDNIKSFGLMTKRNKTANIITREWILTFKKHE